MAIKTYMKETLDPMKEKLLQKLNNKDLMFCRNNKKNRVNKMVKDRVL